VLSHALMSYVFGTAIVGGSVNLITGGAFHGRRCTLPPRS
jgi:hypothetical protein